MKIFETATDSKFRQQILDNRHKAWLRNQADHLICFFAKNAIDPEGGFHALDEFGQPMQQVSERYLHETTRMVHCFAIARLLGFEAAEELIDHGMNYLLSAHRDQDHGGYFWCTSQSGALDSSKQAYGHAFVLLAASSGRIVGHTDAEHLFDDVVEILDKKFWEPGIGATSEEYLEDWQSMGPYRGQNSNMHLTEALMAAFEASGETKFLVMAERIADLIINRHARSEGWRVAEHFKEDWNIDREYSGNPMFRPYGTTPGHALEWARLLINLWELGKRKHAWMPDAAKQLFIRALNTGWDRESGGIFYTLDWDDQVHQPNHFWWPCAEAVGAAAALATIDNDPVIREWYIRIWDYIDNRLIDHKNGGWFPEVNSNGKPTSSIFAGKPDIYHALQACLIPLVPASGSITSGLSSDTQAKIPAIEFLNLNGKSNQTTSV